MLATVALTPAAPARASGTAGYCPDADGVTVVVDFHGLGGSTLVRCAPGTQPTGLAALKAAGISVTGTARWGEAFICRIEGRPGPDLESCIDTPPAAAYWSYWYAADGGDWAYSQQGASGRTPVPGGFEGWSFSLDRSRTTAPPPGVAPQRPAPPPAPTSPAPPSDPGGGSRPAPPGAGDAGPGPAAPGIDRQPGRSQAGGPGPTQPAPPDPPTPAGTAPTSTTPASSPTPAPAPGAGTATVPATVVGNVRDVATARTTSSGVPASTLVGVGLLIALMAAATVAVRRRAAASDPDG